MAGVMHFSNYLRWMEDAEVAFLRTLGLTVLERSDGPVLCWPRVAVQCEYFAPLRFEDEVDVTFRLTAIGRTSKSFEVEFRRGERRVALARGKTVCSLVEPAGFCSLEIPADVRKRLEAHLAPPCDPISPSPAPSAR